MPGPLTGVRVVDMSAIVSGPLAAMLLADQGADVIKVEPPGGGDLMRAGVYRRGGLSAFFIGCNRSKRAIQVDVAKAEGRALVHKLVESADVFLQNWRPGAAARLGLGYEELAALRPGLIYCSISGFGPTGPYAQRRVYDPIIQGITGHVAVQQSPDIPVRDLVRNIISDKSTAYTAAQAITAALFARERGAEGAAGQHIEVPMLDSSLAFFWPDGMMKHTMKGEGAVPGPALYEIYRLWPTKDGQLIWFAASDAEYRGLFRALGVPEWGDDPRYKTAGARAQRAEELGTAIMERMQNFTTREIYERMVAEDVPCGPALGLEELLEDEQLKHNQAVLNFNHPQAGEFRMARPAARFHGTPQKPQRMPPLLGEHTDEILAELGYDAAQIATLREAEVVA